MYFSPLSCYLAPVWPKYSPQHPILKHPQPTFLPQCKRRCFTTVHNNRQPLIRQVFSVLSFGFIQDFRNFYFSVRTSVCLRPTRLGLCSRWVALSRQAPGPTRKPHWSTLTFKHPVTTAHEVYCSKPSVTKGRFYCCHQTFKYTFGHVSATLTILR